MKLRAAFLLGSALSIGACILDADGFSGGTAPADAAPPDAPISTPPEDSTDATGGSVDAGPNLLSNPGFEFGCAGWTTSNTTAVESNVAHSGTRSCLVCATAGLETVFRQTLPLPLEAGAEIVADIWMRAPPTGDASLAPKLQLIGTSTEDQYGPSAAVQTPTATWVRTSALLSVNRTITSVRFDLTINGAPGACVLVDDAALHRTK
jgi:hypothetical protein